MTVENLPQGAPEKKNSFRKYAKETLIAYGAASGKIMLVMTALSLLEFGITQHESIVEKLKRRFKQEDSQK